MKKIISWLSETKSEFQLYCFRRKIQVASLEETIEKIITEKCSISRFGDGEFYLMDGQDIAFQKANADLVERLKRIIQSNENNHLVCISNGINPHNYREFTKKHIKWMRNHFKNTIKNRLKYIDINRKYYNLLISRFWIPFKDKNRAKKVSGIIKNIWDNRNVVIIEGEKTRMGVGNDLLINVRSCQRILCPSTNAFSKYEEILGCAKSFHKDSLFLIALGPTATVLAYDLYQLGYQALDIGHIDLEYEWMKLGALQQIDLPDRYVNEVSGGNNVDDCNDEKYLSEIKYIIKN